MTDDMMHGLSAIAAAVLLLIYFPLLIRYLARTPVRDWSGAHSILVALGLTIESAGILMISSYRTLQIWFLDGLLLADGWTTVSLGLVVGGGVVLIRAATLDHARWKWWLLLALSALWIIYAINWAS